MTKFLIMIDFVRIIDVVTMALSLFYSCLENLAPSFLSGLMSIDGIKSRKRKKRLCHR